MVDRNIVNKLGLSEDKLDEQVKELFGESEGAFLEDVLQRKVDLRLPGTILKGTIVTQIGSDVIVEVGLKSEGVVDAGEFEDGEIEAGKEIEVLLDETDSESGLVLLSKRKADTIRGWENIINTKKEGSWLRRSAGAARKRFLQRSKSASIARAWSRISPILGYSWIWGAWTACCIFPI